MRPLMLTVEGWMPYREEASVEFPDDVFLIAGDTGAGKSALLDALTFALYGEVPRLGAKGLNALVHQGEERAVVTLEFEATGTYWKVTREVRAGTTTKAAGIMKSGTVCFKNSRRVLTVGASSRGTT